MSSPVTQAKPSASFRFQGVIADDLTGAADAAIQFCRHDIPVFLWLSNRPAGFADNPTPGVIAVSSASRHASPESAAQIVSKAAESLSALGCDRFYKKVDSCLRGNIGAETDAILDRLGIPASFIAPAYPAMGRATAGDIHRVNGVPVDQTEVGQDARDPVMDSRLSRLIASQSPHATGHVSLSAIEGGETALCRRIDDLLNQGVRHIVFDAVRQGHLDIIAATIHERYPDVLPVGSAGLAAGLAGPLVPQRGTPRTAFSGNGGRTLFVCGSSTQTLRSQTARLVARFRLPRATLEAARLCEIAGDGGLDGQRLMIAGEWKNAAVVDIAAVESNALVVDPDDVAAGLAEWIAALVDMKRPEILFLSGGDTAEATLRRLDTPGVWLEGMPLEGVIRGRLFGGRLDGATIYTKAGAFGPPDLLVHLYRELQKDLSV